MPTIDEILINAPQRMPQASRIKWAQRQLARMNSPEYLAKKAQKRADAEALSAIKADAFVKNFIAMTPESVANYVNNNTANIAEVRALLTKMAVMLLFLARREYR